ncbi:hypothetical protein [Williamsia sp. CHRR-6]|uniref:hypothetical protein n=1 Tax=Williamsia sp. CHRR-6 TaxID=2835871 RepID=UPI001BD9E2C2|nr:hypothetical protein [Williamsia sp. CHRR-6]MBT0565268.1 hypothetical protein [Williamsia sp. CHRR-6]
MSTAQAEAGVSDVDEPGDSADVPGARGSTTRRSRVGAADRPRANRSPAAQRALDRRRRRATQRSTVGIVDRRRSSAGVRTRLSRPTELVARIPFAVLVIAVLAFGLALTLWLSTRSAQDSYQLSEARKQNQALTDRRDALKKAFESGDSPVAIANKAVALGMIPVKDRPRVVVGSDGRARMVGTPSPAVGAPDRAMGVGSGVNSPAPQPGTAPVGGTAQAPPAAPPVEVATAPAPNVLPGSAPADAAAQPTR